MKQIFNLILIVLLAKQIMGQQSILNASTLRLTIQNMGYYESATSSREKLYWLKEIVRHLRREMRKIDELKRQEEMMKKMREEEKVRKIINNYLMPLTKGNSFMRDFYAGRY